MAAYDRAVGWAPFAGTTGGGTVAISCIRPQREEERMYRMISIVVISVALGPSCRSVEDRALTNSCEQHDASSRHEPHPCKPTPIQLSVLLREVRFLIKEGRYIEAAVINDRIIELDPDNRAAQVFKLALCERTWEASRSPQWRYWRPDDEKILTKR